VTHRASAVVLGLALSPSLALAQAANPDVIGPVTPYVFNKDLRTLPLGQPGPEREMKDRHRLPIDPAWAKAPQVPDPVIQRTMPVVQGGPTPGVNFAGIAFTGPRPPDPIGDVGPNHYVQMVNVQIAIFNKTGTLLAGPVAVSSIWAGFPGPCSSQNLGDPVVVYDRAADRWVVSQFHQSPNGICVAISQTPDPVAGGWFLYDFSGLTSFPDYFKIGVWPNAYFIGAKAANNRALALNRTAMLTGAAATAIVRTTPGVGVHSVLIPADADGPTPPPAGSPGILYRHVDDAVAGSGVDHVDLFEFNPDFATPANTTFTGPVSIPTAPFGSLCNFSFSCVFQPGTTQRLDSVTEWVMWRLAYKNFTTHEVMLVNNAVDTGGGTRPGVRWYELRRTPPGSGAWSIFQQGTFAPGSTTENRWMASVAMDNSGGIGMAYSYTDSSATTPVQPSLRFTGRLAGDPAGQMTQGETTIVSGSGVQTGVNRWGDYAALSIDPVDECTFWFTGEYMIGGNAWATRISSFTLPSCVPVPVELQHFKVE
jgi:hypothetical protein